MGSSAVSLLIACKLEDANDCNPTVPHTFLTTQPAQGSAPIRGKYRKIPFPLKYLPNIKHGILKNTYTLNEW
jgi:hypothetical protein